MSSNIQVLIVEDNPQESLRTEALVHAIGYKILAVVTNADDAITTVEKNQPDIILVDIELEGPRNGIQLVNEIKDLQIPVIFTTGLESETVYNKARNTYPAGYLVKPYNKLTFQTALENAIKGLSQTTSKKQDEESGENIWLQDRFFIKRNNLLQKVLIDDVLYIQSEGNYCDIITDRKFVVKKSLSNLLKKLPQDRFIRIHQRFILQTDKIDKVDLQNNEVHIGSKILPIGPKFREPVLNKLNRLS